MSGNNSSASESRCEWSEASTALDALSPQQQARLTEVLDEYLRGLEDGLPPRPDELLDAHPDLAEPLGAYMESLARLHDVAAAFGHPGEGAEARPPADTRCESDGQRLGDFVLLGEVGRGGMGVVYEARQVSLDRRVALKVLPFAAVLETKQIVRFKNEAQAAAQLHHPNIVPVFAVGVERGVHYYAMQFIDGQPLDRVIASLRRASGTEHDEDAANASTARTDAGATALADAETITRHPTETTTQSSSFLSGMWSTRADYFRAVMRLMVQAADALHAAHAYGVVHRDVKPSNLLLDAHGKLWITDFGLARCQTDRSLTGSGDVVGTRQYMSPEQAAGKAALVDQRTDVYALGATLYELITLHPVWPPGDSPPTHRDDSRDPIRPRRIDPSVPRDLETVVLNSIALDRDERYETAGDLADDLCRVLEGKPTVARPPTYWDRAAKFARRHRRVVGTAAAACLLGIVGLTVATVLVNRERASAQRNFERAERHFREARDAVDQFGSRFAQRLADVPGAERVRHELLSDTLAYYQRFVGETSDDEALRADLATTYGKIGTLNDEMGSIDDAIGAHRTSIEIFGQLAAAEPDAARYRRQLAIVHNNFGLTLRRAGRAGDALDEFHAAVALQEPLVAAQPYETQYQVDLARSHNNIGLTATEVGNTAVAHDAFREAIRLQEDAEQAMTDKTAIWRDLAASCNNLAALVGEDRPDEAVALHRQAADYEARAAEARPDEPRFQRTWALTLNNLGAALARRNDYSAASDAYRQAIGLQKDLLQLMPLDRAVRKDLAVSYNNLGLAYTRLKQSDQAKRSFRNALGFQERLFADASGDPETASSVGGVRNNLGIVLEELGQFDQAAESYQKAVRRQTWALGEAPSIRRYREFLSKHYYNLGRALRKMGRADEAAHAALARKKLWPNDARRLLSVAEELALASQLMTDQSELTADACAQLAIDTLREAVSEGVRLPAELSRSASFAVLRGRSDFESLLHP